MDGFFADMANFGCPDIPGVARHVRVIPFPARQVAGHLKPKDTISPDVALMKPYIPQQYLHWFENEYLRAYPGPRRPSQQPIAINPEPFDIWLRFRYALNAAPTDETIAQLFDAGRRDAFYWVMCNHLAGLAPFHQGECVKQYPLLAESIIRPRSPTHERDRSFASRSSWSSSASRRRRSGAS